ncbi:uncharacterized protein [Anabrus simplex]|uniref:uncharacterized protein n=1 Tax=Anabrus simplex TaxID=316456 RepID=UPI0035A2E4D1
MSPCCYVQLFLFGLLSTGAVSAPTGECTNLRALSNIHLNQVCGDWFCGKSNRHVPMDKSTCLRILLHKVDETTVAISLVLNETSLRQEYTTEDAENAGTLQMAGGNSTVQVIYMSEDGTAMGIASCVPHQAKPSVSLLSKQIPISSEKEDELRIALEQAGLSGDTEFVWESEATCSST